MSKIVLIALYDYHSFGVRGLHSWLESRGHDVRSLYFFYSTYTDRCYTDREIGTAVSWVKEQSPEFVGIGVRSPLFPLACRLSREIRKALPGCRVIFGGAHATGAPESCTPFADYIVRGEGEHALLDILDGRALSGVVEGADVEDLDSLPFPYYGARAHYIGGPARFQKLSYNTSRGCFFSCSYCQECVRPVRRRRVSPDKAVVDLQRYGRLFPDIKWISFSDSVFTHDLDWLDEFSSKSAGCGFTFWGSGCAAVMEDSVAILALLKKTGFSEIRLGVQSGSEYIRKEVFNRKDSLDQIMRACWDAHEMRIVADCDFIIENPYDTASTIKETRDFIRGLPPSASINKFELRYWPGTVLTRRALKDGYITEEDVSGKFLRLGSWSYAYERIGQEGA